MYHDIRNNNAKPKKGLNIFGMYFGSKKNTDQDCGAKNIKHNEIKHESIKRLSCRSSKNLDVISDNHDISIPRRRIDEYGAIYMVCWILSYINQSAWALIYLFPILVMLNMYLRRGRNSREWGRGSMFIFCAAKQLIKYLRLHITFHGNNENFYNL